MKKILLIGGLGFIGKNLYIRLCHNHSVNIFSDINLSEGDHFNTYLNPGDLLLGSICDKSYLEKIVGNYDVIYSLAGLSGAADSLNRPLLDNAVNCIGHLNILEACRKSNPNVLIIFPSSRLVYGKPQYLPVDEKHPLNPETFYAIHKLTAEYYYALYSRLYGIQSIILRISNLYGQFQQTDKYGILNWFIRQALSEKTISVFGSGSQTRDYLYIEDFIDLLVLLLDRPDVFNETYNIGCGRPTGLLESLRVIKELIPSTSWRFVDWGDIESAIETGDYISNIDKITRAIGWSPKTNFYRGIEDTIEYYK